MKQSGTLILKPTLFRLVVAVAAAASLSTAQAAFVAAADLATSNPQSLNPNLSFGGDTTAASSSTASAAVGLPAHRSIFGGNGVNFVDTYIMSYTPGTDADNFFPAAGSLLGSTTGFGTELSTGSLGGGSGSYNVYFTVPSSANINGGPSTVTITGDGAPIVLVLDLNDGGTGADLDPGTAFVGGANNAWFKVGTVDLTAGVTYSLTMEAASNTFVSQRLAGVMWEVIPEPSSFALSALGLIALVARRRTAKR